MPTERVVKVSCFSDVLCIWAYIAGARIEEAQRRFGDQMVLEHRFCSVFGDTQAKIERGWADRDGYDGFNRHLKEVAARFPHIALHDDVWLTTRPASSAGAHLFAKAVRLLEAEGKVPPESATLLLRRLRRAFFAECLDIAQWRIQCQLAEEMALPVAAIEGKIRDGSAFAALANDDQDKQRLLIQGSPTFLLDGGRQKLYGNVGYRVIEANIQELLRDPQTGEASWC